MNLTSPLAWWAAIKWRIERPARQPDFGDMGTAFGLDASLEDAPEALPPPTRHWKGRFDVEAPRVRLVPPRLRRTG